jgi:cell division initiation protein
MSLHPIDIRHQEFSYSFSGYNKKQVRAFLEQIAGELEETLRHQEREMQKQHLVQNEVKQEAVQANQAIEDLKRREELISRTLVFAEKTKADIIANARKEGENIIQEAELKQKRLSKKPSNILAFWNISICI